MTTATEAQPAYHDHLSEADKIVPVWKDDPRANSEDPHEQDYLFDLNGFTVLRGALSADELAQINGFVDDHPADRLESGQWIGDVETQTYGSKDGINFQNIIEGGPVFEKCIDHPSWHERVKRYIQRGDHVLTIDENFLNVRASGGFIPMHSGGTLVRFTSCFRHYDGQWLVGQINILMALTDIGYGDGCTTVIPGSHKAYEDHPMNRDGKAWERAVRGD